MTYIVIFGCGALAGFIAGLLVFRNNTRKFSESEIRGKELIDALKGR